MEFPSQASILALSLSEKLSQIPGTTARAKPRYSNQSSLLSLNYPLQQAATNLPSGHISTIL